jgi:predicted transcriptional regulator
MKMLKRHLQTVHGVTPREYRAKWGLSDDYPMVAANYAKLRSSLALESGLGLKPDAKAGRLARHGANEAQRREPHRLDIQRA